MKDAPPAAAAPHQSPSTPGRSPLKARHLFALLLVLTLAGLLARSVPYLRWQPPAAEGEGAADPRVCRGALHVHLPDDEASFLALVAAAREAGLDFVLFAAAGTFDPAADGREGYYTDAGAAAAGLASPGRPPLLVLVGAELPTDRGNLLLAGGQAGSPYPLTRRSETLVRAAREAGGFALALRPCRQPLAPGAVPSPDRPDPPAGVAGVEALSLAADFTSHLYYPLAEAAVLSLANPAGGLARLARRPAGGRPPAAGLDWPGPPAPVGGIGLGAPEILGGAAPPGPLALAWVTTRLVLPRPLGRAPATFTADREAVLAALAAGAGSAQTGAWGRGTSLRVDRDAGGRLRARTPVGARTWILWRHDGKEADAGAGPERTVDLPAAGTWRAESYRARGDVGLPGGGWLLWSVSAPIRVEPGAAGEGGAMP